MQGMRDRLTHQSGRFLDRLARRLRWESMRRGAPMDNGGYWMPKQGDLVWLNYPDSDRPEGRVVGFVAKGYVRAGQPIIERLEDEEPGPFSSGQRRGDHVVIHPTMLLPFRFGSDEWRRAVKDGQVD